MLMCVCLYNLFFFLMIRRPPISTRTDTLFPYTTLFRSDVAAEITDLIIRKLEEGVPPWSRPWRLNGAGGRPLRHCGTPYQGINTLYLWALGDAQGYRSRYWMTWRQAETLGGHVRKIGRAHV